MGGPQQEQQMSDHPAQDNYTRPSPTNWGESPLDARAHQPAAVGVVVGGGDRCAGVDGEVVVAAPPAAGLAIKEPGAIRHAEPRSQGRDPSIVGSHLDSSERRNKYGTSVIVVRSPVDVPFKSENEVADLPVEPELAQTEA